MFLFKYGMIGGFDSYVLIIWEFRTLSDDERSIWNLALDGIVLIVSPRPVDS